jgi:D-glutamate cyclase
MSDEVLERILTVIQDDVGSRGLRADAADNLVTASAGDFATACKSLAQAPDLAVGIVTGFIIPTARPPSAETDGPLGAIFLARALVGLGARVVLATDAACEPALAAGLTACELGREVTLVTLPPVSAAKSLSPEAYWQHFASQAGSLTHLVAIERVGPNHTRDSISRQSGESSHSVEAFCQEVSEPKRNRCYTMRGRDITDRMSPAHWLFEAESRPGTQIITIGIGDGGNEIGMGKIPWDTIRRNIPSGGLIACRVPTDHLVVCGISNWGAYGLAAGLRRLRGSPLDAELFDPARESVLLQLMVARGPLVDGTTGQPTVSVDGLSMDRYLEPLRRLREMA